MKKGELLSFLMVKKKSVEEDVLEDTRCKKGRQLTLWEKKDILQYFVQQRTEMAGRNMGTGRVPSC